MHLNLPFPLSLAVFAAPAFNVKAESARLITANLCFSRHRKQFSYHVKHAGICCWVAPRCLSDWRLVYLYNLINLRSAEYGFVFARLLARGVEPASQRSLQNMAHKRTLSGTGDAGDTGKYPKREFYIDIFKVVLESPFYFDTSS